MRERTIRLLKKSLPWLVLIGAYLFSVGIYAWMGAHNLDADQSSEMVLASLLNEEGAFLSENWYYSTELRVVSPVPVYQLGLRLFSSWHMARTFSIAVLLAGTVAAFLYLMRSAGIREAGIYAAACLILPISWLSMFMLIYGQFYSMYFILICLILGLLMHLDEGRHRLPRLAVLLALSVYGGMQGVRLLMLCAAPLALSCCLLLVLRARTCASLREALHTPQAAQAAGMAMVCAGMLAGYLINEKVFGALYSYRHYSDTVMNGLNWEELGNQIGYLPRYFGFENGVQLISIDGLTNALALGLTAAAAVCTCALAVRSGSLDARCTLLVWFAVLSMVLGIMLNCMTRYGHTSGLGSVSYYLPGLLLLTVMIFVWLEKAFSRSYWIRTLLLMMIAAVFALNSVQYIRKNFRQSDADYETTAQWLVDHGYTNGFATFWNANLLTEASDGVLEVYTYPSWNHSELYAWLQKKEHFEQLPEGKVFVFVEKIEGGQDVPLAREENLVQETYDGKIYAYDSAQEVVSIQRGAMTAEKAQSN